MGQTLELVFDKLSGTFGIIVLVLVAAEWIALIITKHIKSHKEGFINILSYIIESIPYILLAPIVIYGFMVWVYEYRIATLGYAWYVWVAAYLLYDLMFYLVHRLGHQVRFFWCIHGVHHTAEEMKLTVAVRGSFLGFFHTPLAVLFLPVLGFDPFVIYIVQAIAHLYGLYEHVNENIIGKQPLLERLFITPSVHRIHHAKNHLYLDRNYGETFSIWDKIFGTFQTELSDEKPVYGLMHDHINSESYWQIQLILWKDLWVDIRSASKLTDKIKYVVMPPGWSHVDGGKLAHSYRAEAWKKYRNEKEETKLEKAD